MVEVAHRKRKETINPLGGKCSGCDEWMERDLKRMCLDCERKAKVKRETKVCALPGCEKIFRKAGQCKYCPDHRGMHTAELAQAARDLAS